MDDKENIAEGLQVPQFESSPPQKVGGRKTRSKSIGPGGLSDVSLKEDTGNRRKSAFIPNGILPSKEDEKKRREARRKSLANRRVSFAPEATLHTWDVIEYMENATASSSSSNSTRRNSAASTRSPQKDASDQASDVEPPSTPPEQVDEPVVKESPGSQRDAHQKKRRRSSGIPPLNFNNPEDVFSSSPVNGSSDSGSDDDNDVEETPKQDNTSASISSRSGDSTGSSARLDQALRQATAHAGTQKLDLDENGDMTMELADDEITAAFKPWSLKSAGTPKPSKNLTATFDQENVNPLSPKRGVQPGKGSSARFEQTSVIEEDDDMSMDITRAIGGIIQSENDEGSDDGDATMEFTTVLGGIQKPDSQVQPSRRASLKRRRSSAVLNQGATEQGSPAKKQSRRSSLRNRRVSTDTSVMEDETMDFTMALGGIQQSGPSKQNEDRRSSVNTSFGDETMDFTMVVGGIKPVARQEQDTHLGNESGDDNEELSMELTTVLGDIKKASPKPATPVKSPSKNSSTVHKASGSSTKKSPGRPRASIASPSKGMAQQSPRRTPRKSLLSLPPTTPDDLKQDVANEERAILKPEQDPVKPCDTSISKGTETSTPTPKAVRFGADTSNTAKTPTPSKGILKAPKLNVEAEDPNAPDELLEEPTLRSTAALFNSMKALSTPKKQAQPSPAERATPRRVATPRKEEAPQKAVTPKKRTPRKSISPKKQARFKILDDNKENGSENVSSEPATQGFETERIQLQDFLDMTNIKFMDLTTTKRRHTAAPSSFLDKRASRDLDEQDEKPSLASCVTAAACTVPEFEMYQHNCHELKRYIQEGKDIVRGIEANVSEENPPLFQEFMSAPPDQRYVMSNQLKNMKTFSRLKSKETWYSWRSGHFNVLKTALIKTSKELNQDDAALTAQEALLDATIPALSARHKKLKTEQKQLQQRADELLSSDKEKLDLERNKLVEAESDLEQQKRLLFQLQEEQMQTDAAIDAVRERKVDCLSEIQEAERVREKCRGWSASEVSGLKSKVAALETKYGWSITSAGTDPAPTITMAYAADLEIYFHPQAFLPIAEGRQASPISLTYIGDSASPPRPLTTSKRFFLQFLRAHLHSIDQSFTTITTLLATVKSGWQIALALSEGVHSLEMVGLCEESILSDERTAVSVMLVLGSLHTKVRVTFEVGVSANGADFETSVKVKAEVVYGERYKEDNMTSFVGSEVGDTLKHGEEMCIWGDTVKDLKARLLAKGPKGERV